MSQLYSLKVFLLAILLLLTLRTYSLVWNFQKNLGNFTVLVCCWFAMQQQTSRYRRGKFRAIHSRFSVKRSELTPIFQNLQEVAYNLQKPNVAQKTQIYVFRSLRVKARVRHLQKCPKQSFFVFASFRTALNVKIVFVKSIFTSNLTFINS